MSVARKWVPVSESLAALLEKHNGGLHHVPVGDLFRIGSNNPWDMAAPWHGPEITSVRIQKSLWAKRTVLTFMSQVSDTSFPQFRMEMGSEMDRDSIHNIAEAFKEVLNLKRQE